MSDDEHSESEFYYPDELEFHGKNERASIITNELVPSRAKETVLAKKRLKHSYKSKKLKTLTFVR